MAYAEPFLAGDAAALAEVYSWAHGPLTSRALARGALTEDDAQDAASDAIFYVRGRGARKWNGNNIMGLLNRAVDYMVYAQQRRRNREVLECDQGEDSDDDFEFPEDLEGMEERRLLEGVPQHEYLTSVETTTPEDIVLTENLRQRLESIARVACGDRSWEVYAAHVLHDEPQTSIAERYELSQQRVSQIITEVNDAIRKGLLG
jgi:RNA polymerase sigma factor (sigma-70 family)